MVHSQSKTKRLACLLFAAMQATREVQAADSWLSYATVDQPSHDHDTSSISASKVTFSLHDIEDSSTSFLPPQMNRIQHSFLSGSMVVPCLLFAIMVVFVLLLQALFSDDQKEVPTKQRYDLPIRIPQSTQRRNLQVLETIEEQPTNDEDVETTRIAWD